MSDERIRTVVATLVEPTAHKKQKLRHLQSTYREALEDAVQADATTMTAVNDIVTPYDLPYQAKDALKRHVPQLLKEATRDVDALQSVRRPAADAPAGVSRLWEGRTPRADSQSRVYAVAAAGVPLAEQSQTQTL